MLTSNLTHPLDPLSPEEMQAATGLVRQKKKLGDLARFPVVTLKEPTPRQLSAKGAPDRVALVVVLDRSSGETHEVLVNLTKAKVSGWKRVAVGQPPIIIEEFFAVVEIVKNDPAWRAAAMRRGLSEADLERVQVDPFSAGHFGFEGEEGRRLVRAVAYYRQDLKDNAYAHPLEGLVTYVDLIRGEVFKLVDEGAIPVPRRKGNYLPQFLHGFRDDVKALEITQPQGPSFSVEGYRVEWQRWSFRVGFTPREGLVLHQVGYTDGGRLRPILHRASVSEMVVPYADPGVNHFWKNAFDAGEYGLGKLANSLELGCDCLGHIYYFDAVVADDLGAPLVIPNAICMHEEDYGTLWKHYEFRNETFETRRSRRLVVSFWSTVGNYDYGFFWYFYQDGTLQLEVKLSGIIQTAALMPGRGYDFGGMVTPELGGPTHQHFFNVRLHMNLDGGPNSVQEVEMVRARKGKTDPYGNVFRHQVRTLKTEGEAARVGDNLKGRYWKIINPTRRNAVGEPTAYKLVGPAGPTLLADPKSAIYKRAAFATKHLWVTPFDPEQLHAAGDYPNQNPGDDGLGVWTRADRPIESKDLVVWYNLGATHICRPEDWPIMPVEHLSFSLKPVGFFDQNPALDVPSPKGVHGGEGESCHHHGSSPPA